MMYMKIHAAIEEIICNDRWYSSYKEKVVVFCNNTRSDKSAIEK